MVRVVILATLLVLSPIAAAEVYRCTADGSTVYTGHACPGRGAPADLPALAGGGGTNPGVQALAQQFQRREKHRTTASRSAAWPQRRRVPGVACPTAHAIKQAVDAHQLTLCMTPAEVDRAQPFDAQRLLVHSRLLPIGPSVVEWVYDPHVDNWPAIVRFDNNHVIGYSGSLPGYYREHWSELR